MYMKGRYISYFLKLRARADILAVHPKVFKDTKEITESLAIYNALKNQMEIDVTDESVTCIVPGDGKYCQTGILLAFLTKWKIISVDPIADKPALDAANIKRFEVFACNIEDFTFDGDDEVVFACVHSHAPLDAILKNCKSKKPRKMASLPCCKPHLDSVWMAYFKYEDPYILSPKNIIYMCDEERHEPNI